MNQIPNDEWHKFIQNHVCGDICGIAQGLITTLIIIVPEVKLSTIKDSEQMKMLLKDYHSLLIKYTIIKISKPENINLTFTSKEEFDSKYEGSWYNYFR